MMRPSLKSVLLFPAAVLLLPAFATAQDASSANVHPITSLPKPAAHAASARPAAAATTESAATVAPAHAAPAVEFTQPGQADARPVPAAPATMSAGTATSQPGEAESASSSSSVTFVEAPAAAAPAPAFRSEQAIVAGPRRVKPFGAIGVQLKAGFAGAGLDIAVPLAQRLNVRAGASYFQYSGSYAIDGITINGEVKFRSGNVAFDIFPFGNGFRISPGVTVYNGNNLNAAATVPGGSTFDLNDVTYTSSPTDPVHGTGSMTFGNRTAPSLTLGWGNMIPRNGHHLSIPFEIGVQYISDPKISLFLAGTACSAQGTASGCGQLQTDPIAQDNLRKEEQEINDDIHPLRFYPIISIGVAWSFNLRK